MLYLLLFRLIIFSFILTVFYIIYGVALHIIKYVFKDKRGHKLNRFIYYLTINHKANNYISLFGASFFISINEEGDKL